LEDGVKGHGARSQTITRYHRLPVNMEGDFTIIIIGQRGSSHNKPPKIIAKLARARCHMRATTKGMPHGIFWLRLPYFWVIFDFD